MRSPSGVSEGIEPSGGSMTSEVCRGDRAVRRKLLKVGRGPSLDLGFACGHFFGSQEESGPQLGRPLQGHADGKAWHTHYTKTRQRQEHKKHTADKMHKQIICAPCVSLCAFCDPSRYFG
jgi:hypothetical protein